jgi:hypothetical protein
MDRTAAEPAMPTIVAQDLKTLRVPGKVSAVLWTVRGDRCTLQVVLRGARTSWPKIDLWLVAPEGTIIPPLSRWDSPRSSAKVPILRAQGPEVNFQFPREVSRQGVTAVLTVDGELFREPIQRFSD